MSRDTDACADYVRDPLVYHGSYKRALLEAEVRCLEACNEQMSDIVAPVLCLHGEADPFVPPGPTVAAVGRMSSLDKTVTIYEEARHELVNEINKGEVLEDLRAFVERVTR